MKKLFLTMASLVMLASMAFAQNDPTPMLPSQHGLTDHQPAWGSSQTFDLAAGWNWWSTYINVSGQDGLEALETALGSKATLMQYKSNFLVYENGSWGGTLNAIENENMYAIQMSEAATITLNGPRAAADETTITLTSGWNWIGYPVAIEVPVDDAFANYTGATTGEVLKYRNQFAVYEDGIGWAGTLTTMVPGWGYKLNHIGAETSFVYNTATAKGRDMVTSTVLSTEWQPEEATNPDNMNMIAVVNLNDEELRSENVEIGVFNGETCRGAVHPMYVEALDQYVVFLTMFGEENEPFSFRLLDNETGDIYESNEASVRFQADAVIGKLRSPFELNFNTKNMVANHLHLFPNPVHHGEMVNMILPEGNVTVEVVNMLGSTVKSLRMAGSELSADMAPGVYTVKVIDGEGHVYVDKLIVK